MAGTGRPLAVYVLSLSRGGLRVAIGLPEVAPGLTEKKHTLICLSSFNTLSLSHTQASSGRASAWPQGAKGDQGGEQGGAQGRASPP